MVLERALAAARHDMEFRSSLPVARHYVENLITAFASAVSARDSEALGDLLRTVHVILDSDGREATHVTPGELVDSLAPRNRDIVLTTSNLSIRHSGRDVLYTAAYQAWEAGLRPECAALGTLHGRLESGHQVWTWAEHTITTWSGQHRSTTFDERLAGAVEVHSLAVRQPS